LDSLAVRGAAGFAARLSIQHRLCHLCCIVVKLLSFCGEITTKKSEYVVVKENYSMSL